MQAVTCHLLITFAKSLVPYQGWQNISSALDPKLVDTLIVLLEEFEKLIMERQQNQLWKITQHHSKSYWSEYGKFHCLLVGCYSNIQGQTGSKQFCLKSEHIGVKPQLFWVFSCEWMFSRQFRECRRHFAGTDIQGTMTVGGLTLDAFQAGASMRQLGLSPGMEICIHIF